MPPPNFPSQYNFDGIRFSKIQILQRESTDIIFIYTNLPAMIYGEMFATIKIDVAKGNGVKFVEDNFPACTPEIVEIK